MPQVVISDTSILIDLQRGEIIEAAFKTTYEVAVPDLLYRRELEPYDGVKLAKLGLRVIPVDEHGVKLAQGYRTQQKRLSLADAMSLALAKRMESTLLTGDGTLRLLAESEGVACHGLFWLLDVFEQERVVTVTALHVALHKIGKHPRSRLPKE
jgi:predicted nucleic acid-binding protein